jgi:sulfate adenylyltransferase
MPFKRIDPHGGKLINREARGAQKKQLQDRAPSLKKVSLTARLLSDVEMISIGAFSPLEGFMNRDDYESVVRNRCLVNGLVWTIPVTLAVEKQAADSLKEGEDVALLNPYGRIVAILHLEEMFPFDKKKEAKQVYRTVDLSHPGVAYLYKRGEILLGGKVTLLERPLPDRFQGYRLDPAQTREIFHKKGWKRVVGFQTRNPIHRAHEFIIKCALEIVDGLFLNPLVGVTKKGDVPADVRIACYEVLIDKYFPKDRVVMAIMGASMRYAGPNEAVFHAIIRKNFGCTHFIVGRDHAGVGKFYGTFDAQLIFDEFKPEQIGITPLFFDHVFYCRRCGEMASVKTCPHQKDEHFSLSGSKVRELLSAGQIPPSEFTRPEIADILLNWWRANK